jgi:hypothetical protein
VEKKAGPKVVAAKTVDAATGLKATKKRKAS